MAGEQHGGQQQLPCSSVLQQEDSVHHRSHWLYGEGKGVVDEVFGIQGYVCLGVGGETIEEHRHTEGVCVDKAEEKCSK